MNNKIPPNYGQNPNDISGCCSIEDPFINLDGHKDTMWGYIWGICARTTLEYVTYRCCKFYNLSPEGVIPITAMPRTDYENFISSPDYTNMHRQYGITIAYIMWNTQYLKPCYHGPNGTFSYYIVRPYTAEELAKQKKEAKAEAEKKIIKEKKVKK